MKLRQVYLILALLGTIAPILLIINAMNMVDWDFGTAARDLDAFFVSVFGQVVLTGFFISGLSLTIFVIYEASARSDYYLLWVLPVTLVIGVGAGLPLYLFLRMPSRG